jgi:hypothetical protein
MESAAITTRRVKGIERKGDFWGVILVFLCRQGGESQTVLLLALPSSPGLWWTGSHCEWRRCDAPGIAFLSLAAVGDCSGTGKGVKP